MWDQYAGEDRLHRGACLIIDFAKLQQYLDHIFTTPSTKPDKIDPVDGLEAEGNLFMSGYVRYSNDPPERFDLIPRPGGDLESYLNDRKVMTNKVLQDLYMTKNIDWESEHEYRIVFRVPSLYPHRLDSGLCFSLSDCLRGIVLGQDYDDMSLTDIRDLLRDANLTQAEVFRCRWEAGQPMLEPAI